MAFLIKLMLLHFTTSKYLINQKRVVRMLFRITLRRKAIFPPSPYPILRLSVVEACVTFYYLTIHHCLPTR